MIRRPLLATMGVVWLSVVASTWPLAAAERHALLVGCSKYVAGDIRPLVGAENDVEGFRRLLSEQLQFDDIVTLVGWPDDVAKRPSFANIAAAFERLIHDVEPDSQIVVLMAGHGFRFPLPDSQEDVLDPSNPEPDGLDESFLAADYHAGQNMILDNQIGQWLDQLKAKGAHVWIVFDSCFSGTMTRGGEQEVTREVSPAEAGVSVEAIQAAQRRAAERLSGTRAVSGLTVDGFDVPHDKPHSGSVVAFYAAQEFEPAPEVTRPQGANESSPDFKHGLLSYHLEQLLRDRNERITYADLGRSLVGRYRADGRRRPTPFWEGDLDREVLGLDEWPQPQGLFLEHVGDGVRLSGGQLAGLSKNTIVAVYEPTDKDLEHPLGHVQVTEVSPTAALVESVAFGNLELRPLDMFPDNSSCRIASRDFGDTRIKLQIGSVDGNATSTIETALSTAIRETAALPDAVFQLVDPTQNADWSLVALSLETTTSSDGRSASSMTALLPAASVAEVIHAGDGMSSKQILSGIPHSLFTEDALADPEQFAKLLGDDMQKIHVWHNIWRLTGEYTEPSSLVPRQEIRLDLRRLTGSDDTSIGTPLKGSQLIPGDSVLVQVVNTGYQPYWYVVFYLNGRFGIQHVKTDAIRGRNFQDKRETQVERDVLRFGVNTQSVGTNGFVVIAVSQKEHTHRPDYRFLAQSSLGNPTTRNSTNTSDLTSPFERLLLKSTAGRQATFRSSQSPDRPQISSWSWVTAPQQTASD